MPRKFCKWATKLSSATVRLPSEAEWEYAARGPESRRYPWGNRWEGAAANAADSSLRATGYVGIKGEIKENDGYPYTSPVGIYKTGASWCGAFDMCGNVWQWVEDWSTLNYYAESPLVDPPGSANGHEPRAAGAAAFTHSRWQVISAAQDPREDTMQTAAFASSSQHRKFRDGRRERNSTES